MVSEQPRRVPLGKRLSDDELDELAEMTPEHIRDAQTWWQEQATAMGRALIRARGVVRQPTRGQNG